VRVLVFLLGHAHPKRYVCDEPQIKAKDLTLLSTQHMLSD